MARWTTQVARLGAELGPEPAQDLLPMPRTVVASVAVERVDGGPTHTDDPAIGAAVAALRRLLGRTPRPWCGPALDLALAGLDPTWAPVHAVRLAAAVAAGLEAGHLPAGSPWAIHVIDPTGAAGPALVPVLDLIGGLLDGWDLTLAPPSVSTNVGSLLRRGAGYRATDGRLATVPDLWIELVPGEESGERTDDAGPPPQDRDAPSVVVRPAPAPQSDPGPPPAPGPPPNPEPALDAAARWCFPLPRSAALERSRDADGTRVRIAGLFDGSWPPPPGYAPTPIDALAAREVADLLLQAEPDLPARWCSRALVEARHPAGSRVRHARLIEAAARTAAACEELRLHACGLRREGRSSWALDVWAVADADLAAQLAGDVMLGPEACVAAELALALAERVEAAASAVRTLTPEPGRGLGAC